MPDISYLIVNTNGRELLLRCLDAVFAHHPPELEAEVWVCDNASDDGSADAVTAAYGERVGLVRRTRRHGKPANDNALLERATAPLCLLLNEDSELCPGAVQALVAALGASPGAAVAGAQLLDPSGAAQPCAWRFPGVATAVAGAVFAHRWVTVQSHGEDTREVDWVQSSAMLVRREAYEAVGGLDEQFFVYSDEVDWERRLRDAGWSVLLVPSARAVHHEQLTRDAEYSSERIVEFHRNRDRYVRKHDGAVAAFVVRLLTAWAYGLRALAAVALPGASPARFAAHARAALLPGRGDGVAEAAARVNARLDAADRGGMGLGGGAE